MNTGDLWSDADGAWLRVRRMQTKLHQWAVDDPDRRFDDLYNLVHHPDFLAVAWERVRATRGAHRRRGPVVPAFIADDADIVAFLKNSTFTPQTGAGTHDSQAGQRRKAQEAGDSDGGGILPRLPVV